VSLAANLTVSLTVNLTMSRTVNLTMSLTVSLTVSLTELSFLMFCVLQQSAIQGGADTIILISPWLDQEGNKLQRQNSGFIQPTHHEAQ